MFRFETVNIRGKEYEFFSYSVGTAPLLILRGTKGYAMCGYLNLEAAEKLGDTAVRVTGVKDLETLLKANVVGVTSKARSMGLSEGQKVDEIISLL
ncbi:MAG: DUF1805 domain-containing protein [Thermoplasmataceae archaeon]